MQAKSSTRKLINIKIIAFTAADYTSLEKYWNDVTTILIVEP